MTHISWSDQRANEMTDISAGLLELYLTLVAGFDKL